MKTSVIAVVIATGITSVATQIAVIREFLCLFSGNEFVIAVTLFNWLFLSGCGTLLYRFSCKKFPASAQMLSGCSLVLCFVGIIQIPVVRVFYDRIFLTGQAVGFYQTLIFTGISFAPYCILVGALLPMSLDLEKKRFKGADSTRIYIADNIGDAFGGAVFSFVLVLVLTPVQAVCAACAPLLFFAFRMNGQKAFRLLYIPLLCIMGLCLASERQTLTGKGTVPSFYRETPYGRVVVTEKEKSFTFFQNNQPLFDTRNTAMAEKTVHYPLSQVKSPERVLVISAISGIFKEFAKYDLSSIDYVEIDPSVTEALFSYGFLARQDRVRMIHQDARQWLASTDQMYDAVILTLSDPDTFQVNRFFTRTFFALVAQHLKPGGVFSFSMTGYDNYPSAPLVEIISSMYNTLKTCFGHVLILPGEQLFFLSGNRQKFSLNIPELLREKGVSTRHVQNTFHGDISSERIAFLNEFLDPNAPLNQDFSPVLIRISFKKWFLKFNTSPQIFSLAVGILLVIWVVAVKGSESVLFFTGFFSMGAEMLILFVFQIFFGYVYVKVGMIVTIFLAGLLPGAYTGGKVLDARAGRWIAAADISLAVLMAAIAGILTWIPAMLNENACFVAAFGFGFFCGFEFPCAAKIQHDRLSVVTRLFAADLAGAAFGVLFFTLVLVPGIGLIKAALVLAAVKLVGLIRFLLWKQ
nr:fused MFS/spermidine synthase [uncultured Desulfobacter sp.]